MKDLEKIFKCNNVFPQTKTRNVKKSGFYGFFSVVIYGYERWTGKILMLLNIHVGKDWEYIGWQEKKQTK